jgi:hypothetical protein
MRCKPRFDIFKYFNLSHRSINLDPESKIRLRLLNRISEVLSNIFRNSWISSWALQDLSVQDLLGLHNSCNGEELNSNTEYPHFLMDCIFIHPYGFRFACLFGKPAFAFIMLILIFAYVAFGASVDNMSFTSPIIPRHRDNWELLGTATSLSGFVRLTPTVPGKQGMIASRNKISVPAFTTTVLL